MSKVRKSSTRPPVSQQSNSTTPSTSTHDFNIKLTSNNRSFGAEISGNRRFNCEFTSEQRAAIVPEIRAGKTLTEVAADYHTTPSTVYKTKRRWESYLSNASRPRKWCPRKLTKLQIIRINSYINRHRELTWNDLLMELDWDISQSTLKRRLQSHWSRKLRAKKRISLSEGNARERLQFARSWLPRIDEFCR